MSRKRKDNKIKRKGFNVSLPTYLIEEFKKEAEIRNEVPSHIIKECIEKYLKKK
jgi:hypothetical protein